MSSPDIRCPRHKQQRISARFFKKSETSSWRHSWPLARWWRISKATLINVLLEKPEFKSWHQKILTKNAPCNQKPWMRSWKMFTSNILHILLLRWWLCVSLLSCWGCCRAGAEGIIGRLLIHRYLCIDNDQRKSEKVDIGPPCIFNIYVDILTDSWDLKYNEFTSTSFQVFGPEISTYFTDPYTFLHFEVWFS